MSTINIDGNSNKTLFVLSCIDCSINTSDKVTSNEPEAVPIYEHDLAILNGTYDNNSKVLYFDIKNLGTNNYSSIDGFASFGLFYGILKVYTDIGNGDPTTYKSFIHNGITYYTQGPDDAQLCNNFTSATSVPLQVFEQDDHIFVTQHLVPSESKSFGINILNTLEIGTYIVIVDPWMELTNDGWVTSYLSPGGIQIESEGAETTETSVANNYFLFNV